MSAVNFTYGSLSNQFELNVTVNMAGLMTANINLHEKSSDYYVQLIVAFNDDTGNFGNVFLNRTIDVCKFLSTPSYEALVQLYYKQLLKHENNIPKACPIGGTVSKSRCLS